MDFGWTGTAKSDSIEIQEATLPSSRARASAVWTGEFVYIFGGTAVVDDTSVRTDEIVRYDPATDTTILMSAKLPTGRKGTSAVWDGQHAYVFGGVDENKSRLDEILRYDPETDSIEIMAATLPTGRHGTAAIWTGDHAYIFGGCGADLCGKKEILRYDPTTDTLTVMSAELPVGREWPSATWNGTHAFIFGGATGGAGSVPLDDVIRYDPSTDTAETAAAKLPVPMKPGGAIWDGHHGFLFGGCGTNECGDDPLDWILRYDAEGDRIDTMNTNLPVELAGAAAIWNGSRGFVIGGFDGVEHKDEILKYTLAPASPVNLGAETGPAAGEIELDWEAPANNTYSVLTNYRVYRGTTPDDFSLVAEIDAETSYIDTGLRADTTYFYRVSAVNDGRDEGPLSVTANAKTPGPPEVPRRLSAAPGPGLGDIDLRWDPPEDDGGLPVTNYRIYRGNSSGNHELLAEVANETSFTDDNASLTHTHFYVITAVNLVGQGPESNEACAAANPWRFSINPVLGEPCPPPADWSETTLANESRRVNGTTQTTPGIDVEVLTVHGHPNESAPENYIIEWWLLGEKQPDVEFFTNGLVTQEVNVSLLHVPPQTVHVPNSTINVTVKYWEDPNHGRCLLKIGNQCLVDSPVDPAEPEWLTNEGARAALVISSELVQDGESKVAQTIVIPFVGQVVGGSDLSV